MPYSHGGYSALLPFLLHDPAFESTLKDLEPSFYIELSTRLRKPANYLIKWAENDPLCAAYGHSQSFNVVEWDVFLPPDEVRSYIASSSAMEKGERERAMDAIFRSMIIAHGSTPQLFFEQVGYTWLSRMVFHRVKRCRRSLGGGMTVEDWCTLFSRAMGHETLDLAGALSSVEKVS